MLAFKDFYFVRTPKMLVRLFPNLIWQIPDTEKVVYLTFDDGPNPIITEWILNTLDQFKYSATFFCLGEQVTLNKDVYYKLTNSIHSIGNHGFKHLNGWSTNNKNYLENIALADEIIDSNLYRPPYGKLKYNQLKSIRKTHKIVMWSVLSSDFDDQLSPSECVENCIKNTFPGSIITFHDNVKSFDKLKIVLPQYLNYLRQNNYQTKVIPNQNAH